MQIPGLGIFLLSGDTGFMDGHIVELPGAELIFKLLDPFPQTHKLPLLPAMIAHGSFPFFNTAKGGGSGLRPARRFDIAPRRLDP